MLTLLLLLVLTEDQAFSAPIAVNRGDWLTDSSYVDRAIGLGHAGVTEADIFVDGSGTPKACYVVVSSGSKDLDGQSCAAPMHKGKFKPARDESGKPTYGIYRYRIAWRMTDAFTTGSSGAIPADITLAVAKLPQEKNYLLVKLRYVVDEAGQIIRCGVEQTSGFSKVDNAACTTMPDRYTFAPARDEAGVARTVVRTQSVAFETKIPAETK